MSRINYPIQAIGFAPNGTSVASGNVSGYRAAKGVQTLSIATNFSLDQVFELGQSALYENVENVPNIDISVEKVVDGYALLQHLATSNAVSPTLLGRYNDNRCQMAVAFYPLLNDAASGTPLSYVFLSGVYMNGVNWNIPVQGSVTESIKLVCNDKTWFYAPSGTPFNITSTSAQFANTDTPVLASGGVQRRENVDMVASRWPTQIPGISPGGAAPTGQNPTGINGQLGVHLQNVTISVNMGRTDLLELGRRAPYFRYLNIPVEIDTSISVTPAAGSGDTINAVANSDNLVDQQIYVVLNAGTRIDCGTRNKLVSVTQDGGSTGGDNVTVTYNFKTFNDYTCRQTASDPAGL